MNLLELIALLLMVGFGSGIVFMLILGGVYMMIHNARLHRA